MDNNVNINSRDKQAFKTKIRLFSLLIIAAVLAYLGYVNLNKATFHDDAAFSLLQKSGKLLSAQYLENKEALELQNKDELKGFFANQLSDIFSNLSKEDKTEYVASLYMDKENAEEILFKQLSFIMQMDGAKIKEKQKRELQRLSLEEKLAVKTEILDVLLAKKPLEEASEKLQDLAKGKKNENEMLLQSLFSMDKNNIENTDKELAKGLKRNIRGGESKILACKLAEENSLSSLDAFLIANSKSILLIAFLIAIDVIMMLVVCIRSKDWYLDLKWILILAIVDFLLVFQLFPMIYLVLKAFFPEGSFTLNTMARLYTHSMNLEAMKNTLIIAFFTMVLGTLIAFPLAWLVGRTNLHGKKFFRALFVLTYMVPPYVGAMAWLRLLNPNVGTINLLLRSIFNIQSEMGPLNIYTIGGLIWVLSTFYYPYAFITISRAMEKMDPSLEEASKISGASPIMTVFKITLPMTLPSLIAGALLVFIGAASAYGIPAIIGTQGRVHTVTTRIVEYFGLGITGLNDATGMAVFLMILSMLILFVSDRIIARKQYITVSGKSTRPSIVELGKWRIPLTILVSLFACIVIFIPFLTILSTSLKLDIGKSVFDPNNFTFNQWKEVFARGETLNSLKNSLIFGLIASTIGIAVAITMSYLLQRTKIAGRKIPDFLIALGSGTPSVVIALGLIMTMNGSFGVSIYNTPIIIVVAYLIKYLMMGMRTVVSSMSQIHASLEECSQISGASWFKTMLKITGPLIFPSIAAGWFLIFIPSFYELSMTTLLYSNTTKTIGYQLYEYWIYHSQPQACAMAFGILSIVILLNFILNKLSGGEFSI